MSAATVDLTCGHRWQRRHTWPISPPPWLFFCFFCFFWWRTGHTYILCSLLVDCNCTILSSIDPPNKYPHDIRSTFADLAPCHSHRSSGSNGPSALPCQSHHSAAGQPRKRQAHSGGMAAQHRCSWTNSAAKGASHQKAARDAKGARYPKAARYPIVPRCT